MKRHLIFLLFVLVSLVSTYAQNSLIAVLCHDGEIRTFTGVTALSDAYKFASEGDMITLSPGSFNGIEITKAVTIRGAGMYGANATIINSSLSFKKLDTGAPTVIEGVSTVISRSTGTGSGDIKDVSFIKCNLRPHYTISNFKNCKYIHCDINYSGTTNHPSIKESNLLGCRLLAAGCSDCIVENCILQTGSMESQYSSTYWGKNNNYTNCIFDASFRDIPQLSHANTFLGCVYIGTATDPFVSPNPDLGTNRVFGAGTEYLKKDSYTFELLDELQTSWLGTDGTQVGMHGGTLPFDPTTSNLQIKRFEVSSKTSADGKLSVDIEVDIK